MERNGFKYLMRSAVYATYNVSHFCKYAAKAKVHILLWTWSIAPFVNSRNKEHPTHPRKYHTVGAETDMREKQPLHEVVIRGG